MDLIKVGSSYDGNSIFTNISLCRCFCNVNAFTCCHKTHFFPLPLPSQLGTELISWRDQNNENFIVSATVWTSSKAFLEDFAELNFQYSHPHNFFLGTIVILQTFFSIATLSGNTNCRSVFRTGWNVSNSKCRLLKRMRLILPTAKHPLKTKAPVDLYLSTLLFKKV